MSKDITLPNPPAFPSCEIVDNKVNTTSEGMTLRDHFAGIALTTFKVGQLPGYYEDYAKSAYMMADAMLLERTKQK